MMNRCLFTLLSLFATATFAAEPAFQDKTLSEWVGRLSSNSNSAIHALAQIGTPSHVAIPAVLRAMPDGEDAGFSNFFTKLGATAVPALERELQNPERAVRRHAAVALGMTLNGNVNNTAAVKVLGAALRHGDVDVRKYAAISLLRASAASSAPYAPALKKMMMSSDPDENLAAAAVLFQSGMATDETVALAQVNFEALPPYLQGLRGSPQFRYAALSSFVRSELCRYAPGSLSFLRAALNDPEFAYEALSGFEKLGPLARAAISEIQPFVNSESFTHRYYALLALRAIRQDQPDLKQFSKLVLEAMLLGDARKQAPLLSRNFKPYEGLKEMLKLESERGEELVESLSVSIIGTADYAIASHGGLSMEFVLEDGAWKLLYIYYRLC